MTDKEYRYVKVSSLLTTQGYCNEKEMIASGLGTSSQYLISSYVHYINVDF